MLLHTELLKMVLIANHLVMVVIIGFLFESLCNCTNYCGVNICNNSKQHTLCKYRSDEPARHCINFEKLMHTDKDKMAILDKINSRRNKVSAGDLRSLPSAANMLKLEWNMALEMSAQRWANQCVKHNVPDIKDSCRDLEGVLVGQNIATILGEAPGLTAAALVDVWYMELLNMNSSILTKYQPSYNGERINYDYFTQLIWAESNEVGCGGVKFKERYEDDLGVKHRTIYRLVCNFAPGGNRPNNSVYISGLPCSKCPPDTTCDVIYKSLCSSNTELGALFSIETEEKDFKSIDDSVNSTITSITEKISEIPSTENLLSLNITSNTFEIDAFTPFDFMSDSYNFLRHSVSETTTKKEQCKELLQVDDVIELLKMKLSDDPMFKKLLSTKPVTQNYYNGENTFTDPSVEAFVSKIYSKKETPTTSKTIDNDVVNSTFLVDLIEAVIFKSGGHLASEYPQETIQTISEVTPIKIHAELAETKLNYDFTGHYFFPEDDEDIPTETSEFYYDVSSSLPLADVVSEIEDIRKSSYTKDFLEEILDSDLVVETSSTQNLLSPDDMTIYKSGHSVMKKFLKDVNDISRKTTIHNAN